MAKVFALHRVQKDLINQFCFNNCHILVGTLVDSALGEMYVCKTEGCPHEEKRMKRGECMDGEVWLRKLVT